MTVQCPCLASNFMKYLRVCKLMSYFIHCGCVLMVPVNGTEIMRIQKRHNSPDTFQAHATDETQSVGSSRGVMTPSFTILFNSALTLGHVEIGHFQGVCMTGLALSPRLMVYSPGN